MNAETNTPSVYVTPEMAKRLKEAGYPQASAEHYWHIRDDGKVFLRHYEQHDPLYYEFYAAPTFEEVARELPGTIDYVSADGRDGPFPAHPWFVQWDEDRWQAAYSDEDGGLVEELCCVHASAAEAAALLWLAVCEAESGAVPDAEETKITRTT